MVEMPCFLVMKTDYPLEELILMNAPKLTNLKPGASSLIKDND